MVNIRARDKARLLNTMRNLIANGWTDEALMVDTAAQVLGGDDKAKAAAQRVWDEHFKITPAN